MDTDKKDADAELKTSADEIRAVDATQGGPRGNVHSESEGPAQNEAPPPLAH